MWRELTTASAGRTESARAKHVHRGLRDVTSATRDSLVAGNPVRVGLIVGLTFLAMSHGLAVSAQPPAGYYSTIDASNATALRLTLHDVIDDHTRFPYTAATTDTWDIINLADEDPNESGRIVDVYKNASYTKIPGGVGPYNREHSWPNSYGFPDDNPDNSAYTDVHHLFASDVSYNGLRGNQPFRFCNAGCTENTTSVTSGRGGGSGVYPGNSNWTQGSSSQGTWETWDGRKGDIARAILYMDIRYEGGSHGVTGALEPDLIVTDSESLIASGATGSNEAVAHMGMLSVLLQWHAQDPPDSRELWRNEVVFSFQGNRNPFIDHPEWVGCLFESVCNGTGDTTPPAPPSGLVAVGGSGRIDLMWNASSESDLAGYHVERATSSGGPYARTTGGLLTSAAFADTNATPGTTFFYVVRATDTAGNESGSSNEVFATPTGGGGGTGSLLLSEVVYDVSGGDDGFEWVELWNAGTSPVDLSGFCLANGGTSYVAVTASLSGTILPGATFVVGGPTSSAANGTPSFDQAVNFTPDLQNSGTTADGVALFAVACGQIGGSVPIDAVLYGASNGNGLIDETGAAGSPDVGDAPAGSSLERVDVAGTWTIQANPTPNSTPLASPGTSGDLVLSEILYDVSGSDDGLEWIELYNRDSVAIDLAGFSLGLAGVDYVSNVVQLNGVIPAGQTFLVGGPTSGAANASPQLDQAINFNPDLENSGSAGDGVALFGVPAALVSAATVPLDAVIYGPNNNNSLIDDSGAANAPNVGDAPANASIERADTAGNWRIQPSPTPNSTPLNQTATVVTLSAIAAHDGWVRESSEGSNIGGARSSTSTSASGLRAGDNRSDRQYKGIVSFDTSSIPSGATITSVTLRLRRGTVVGTNPFSTHGTCWVDVNSGGFGGSTSLANSDFQASTTVAHTASLSTAASNGAWSEAALNAAGLAAINTSGVTQLRFYFDRDDNDDRGNDYIGYYAANNSTPSNHPQLVVTFE